ncbi:MAG: tetratricopeptide repeat protein [Archangium sp.]|nr:tetratricopeptide repeat protein [Archangium sp.]
MSGAVSAKLSGARVALLLGLLAAPAFAQEDPSDLPELKGEAKARIQNLDQYLEDWDLESARSELAALEKLAPADVEPLAYYQGRIAFEEGRYADAQELLGKAGLTDKPGSWVRLAKDTGAITGNFERAESEHFIFLYPKGKDAVLVPWALDALEAVRAALEKDLGYAPPGKIRVEIVSSASELAKVSTLSKEAIKTTGTIAICKFNKLMVTSPKAVVTGYDWLDTVAHEYVHLVVSRKSRNTVPIWMHEGLAKYLESRWRGPAGGAMTPPTLALLGSRVKSNKLVPFEKMHPSMALLPTAEDAATAFAEVFFAIKLIDQEGGPQALERMLDAMSKGVSDRAAVELVMKRKWPEFEKSWMASLKKQPYPKDLLPPSSNEKKELLEAGAQKKEPKKKGREVSFGDFDEVKETDARRAAHLGELFRERKRMGAASEAYGRAYKVVGDKYESVSNKYALALLELRKFDQAAVVLEGSLKTHPGSASTNVHLGRIYLRARRYDAAKKAYLDALAVNPFDPEVHVALYAAGDALNDATLKTRAKGALKVLLQLDDAAVPQLAKKFTQSDDLSQRDLEAPEPPRVTPDAG